MSRFFLLTFAVFVVARLFEGVRGWPPEAGWPGAILLFLALAGTVAALARTLPLETALLATLLAGTLRLIVHVLGQKMGLPSGQAIQPLRQGAGSIALPLLFPPLLSTICILNSPGAARFMLSGFPRRRAPGFWTIGLACVLVAASAFPGHRAVPAGGPEWLGFVGAILVKLFVLGIITPWLIDKRADLDRMPSPEPLWWWMAVNLVFWAGWTPG